MPRFFLVFAAIIFCGCTSPQQKRLSVLKDEYQRVMRNSAQHEISACASYKQMQRLEEIEAAYYEIGAVDASFLVAVIESIDFAKKLAAVEANLAMRNGESLACFTPEMPESRMVELFYQLIRQTGTSYVFPIIRAAYLRAVKPEIKELVVMLDNPGMRDAEGKLRNLVDHSTGRNAQRQNLSQPLWEFTLKELEISDKLAHDIGL